MSNALKIKQSPKLPAETRREQLLESARELFVRKGYRGTSTEDIARNAGLTKGALYFHFKNKEEILLALVKLIAAGFRAELDKALPQPSRPEDVVRFVLQSKKCAEVCEFNGVMDIWVQSTRIPRVHKFIADNHRRTIAFFCDHMDPSLGRSRQERKRLAVMVFALADGLAVHRVLHPGTIQAAPQIALFETLMALYRRKPGRRRPSRPIPTVISRKRSRQP